MQESGLTEAELRLCRHACAIPTGRMQPSMNLSHAVAVILSDLYQRSLALGGEMLDEPGATPMPQFPAPSTAASIMDTSSLQQQGVAAAAGWTLQPHGDMGSQGSEPAPAAELESLLKHVGAIAESVGIT